MRRADAVRRLRHARAVHYATPSAFFAYARIRSTRVHFTNDTLRRLAASDAYAASIRLLSYHYVDARLQGSSGRHGR